MMETIAGRRLLSTAAVSAARHRPAPHHPAPHRRGSADDSSADSDAEMIAVLRSAGVAVRAGAGAGASAGAGAGALTAGRAAAWRSAASNLFTTLLTPPLRNIATEPSFIRRAQPLFPGRQQHCLEVAYVSPSTEDEDRVLDFMKRTFFRHEPTMIATGLSGRVPESMLAMYIETLREGLSVMAINADNPCEILGVAINGPVRKGVDSKQLRNMPAECEGTRKIYDFWAYLAERPEGWPDNLECVMEMKAVATDPKAARSGLAANLTVLSRELAKDKFDYPGFRADCTSLFSAKMAERIRLPKVLCFRYKDYLNQNGQPVFQIPAPHTEVCVFVDSFYSPQLPYDGNHED